MGGGAHGAAAAVAPVRMALARAVHRRPLPADGAAHPARRPTDTVGQCVHGIRGDRARRLCVPVDVARRLARRLALPSRIHRGALARDPALSLVPVARSPRWLGVGTLALSPGATAGRGGVAGGCLPADARTLPVAVDAALGLRAQRLGRRYWRIAAARRPPWTAHDPRDRDELTGQQRRRTGLDGAAPTLGACVDVLDDGGRPAAAPCRRSSSGGERGAGGRRPATDLSAAGATRGRDHRWLGAAPPSAQSNPVCGRVGVGPAALPRLPPLGLDDIPRYVASRANHPRRRRSLWLPGALTPRRERPDRDRPREPAVARRPAAARALD